MRLVIDPEDQVHFVESVQADSLHQSRNVHCYSPNNSHPQPDRRDGMRHARKRFVKLLRPQFRQRTARCMANKRARSNKRNLDNRILADKQNGHRSGFSVLKLIVLSAATCNLFGGERNGPEINFLFLPRGTQLGRFPGCSAIVTISGAGSSSRFTLLMTNPPGSGRRDRRRCMFFAERDMRHFQFPRPTGVGSFPSFFCSANAVDPV